MKYELADKNIEKNKFLIKKDKNNLLKKNKNIFMINGKNENELIKNWKSNKKNENLNWINIPDPNLQKEFFFLLYFVYTFIKFQINKEK